MSYLFHPAAEKEYLEAIAYYEFKRAGLGVSFLAEFEQILEKACASPQRYRIANEPDVRCIAMLRFPYSVLYREVSGTVQVLAVAHHRRCPHYWLERSL